MLWKLVSIINLVISIRASDFEISDTVTSSELNEIILVNATSNDKRQLC